MTAVLAPALAAVSRRSAFDVEALFAARRRPSRRFHRRGHYAIRATENEIVVPRLPLLGFLRQSHLIREAQSGGIEAKRMVWLSNARLTYSVLNRYRVRPEVMADLFQEAQLGLANAIAKFDVDRLNEFSTYAFAAMKGWVLRGRGYFLFSASVRASSLTRYLDFRRRVVNAPSRGDWFNERERLLDQDAAAYERLVRLHAIAEPEPLDTVDDPAHTDDPVRAVIDADEKALLTRRLLRRLDERARLVITRRYGLDGRGVRTLGQIGKSLGLTRERVRQIQLAAEDVLRDTPPAVSSEGEPLPGAEGQ